jgi:hypothetical protein
MKRIAIFRGSSIDVYAVAHITCTALNFRSGN